MLKNRFIIRNANYITPSILKLIKTTLHEKIRLLNLNYQHHISPVIELNNDLHMQLTSQLKKS